MRIAPSALLSTLLLLALGCRPPAPEQSVVLVTLDTTRVDLLGAYDGRGVTPNLDEFADAGLRFERAFTTAPYTGPSHASILTGHNPPRHGLRDYLEQALPESATTLAEILGDLGYETAAFVSTYVLDPRFGLDQGFEVYDSPNRDGGKRHWRFGRLTVLSALEWLDERDRARPFFLWVHLYDVHGPYAPAMRYRKPLPEGVEPKSPRGKRQRYYEQAAVIDELFGMLRDKLASLRPEPIWVVVADHGELLGHHGRRVEAHSNELVDATLRVPLILALPGVAAGVRVDPVSLIDVMPTLLSALGLPVPDDIDGRDLLTGPFEADRSLYSETFYEKRKRAETGAEAASLRDGRFVLLSRPAGVQLFDLSSDPSERVDVSREYPGRLAALRAELEALREGWAQSTPSRALDLDPEEEADHRRRLKALGYVE